MAVSINVRRVSGADWSGVWAIIETVIRGGQSYPYARDMTATEARRMWFEIPAATYVAEDGDGCLLGTYYIKPNQPTLGAHVANCGYIVAESARGQGVARQMCEHSQSEAIRLGYRAMQYNLVVSTNTAGVHLWKKMGFTIIGTLPGAFDHALHGFVDAHVMYKQLSASTNHKFNPESAE